MRPPVPHGVHPQLGAKHQQKLTLTTTPSSSSPADDASSSSDDDAWASWENRSTADVNLHVKFLVSEAKKRRRRESGSAAETRMCQLNYEEEDGTTKFVEKWCATSEKTHWETDSSSKIFSTGSSRKNMEQRFLQKAVVDRIGGFK